jgi:ComF family protein
MIRVKEIRDSFLHLLFPHVCAGCGSDLLDKTMLLCLRCLYQLPVTNFERFADNPIEKIFWGRVPLHAATAQYYFSKGSIIQNLMHQFKYRTNRGIGILLGRLMGESIRQSGRFPADGLVPLPLNSKKEKARGYNQAAVLCEGIAESLHLPVIGDAVIRPSFTESQTRKGRVERWKNIEGKFLLKDMDAIRNRHLLLVDDVITTGATLESCATELLKAGGITVSVAALCYSSR